MIRERLIHLEISGFLQKQKIRIHQTNIQKNILKTWKSLFKKKSLIDRNMLDLREYNFFINWRENEILKKIKNLSG